MEIINYIIYTLIVVAAFFVYKTSKKTKLDLVQTQQYLAGVTGDVSVLQQVRITIQDILISYVLKLISDTLISEIEDKGITDADSYLPKIQEFINDKTQKAMIDSAIVLPDLLVNMAKAMMGDDSYNQFIERTINTAKAEYFDPFIDEISGITDAVGAPREVMDKWSTVFNRVSAKIDIPVSVVKEEVLPSLNK